MSNQQAIMAIESLRAGIPTRLSTRLLPDLRASVTDKILLDLASFETGVIPAGRILWGQYGQGKTHALTAIEHQALDHNFAVSRVSLSREVSCHNLFSFYSQIAPRIRTPDSTLEGIQQYLNRLHPVDIRQTILFQDERYRNNLPLTMLEDYLFAEGEDKEKLYGALLGLRLPGSEISRMHRSVKGEKLPSLHFKATEHADAFLGLMADTLQMCGFEGWVILIDEIELIGRLGKLSRYKAYKNLDWLLNWGSTQKYPIYTVAAAATRLQDDLWYGKEQDDRSMMPELAEAKWGPAAGMDMIRFFMRAVDNNALNVLPARSADLETLLDCVADLHGQAYEWQPDFSSSELIRHVGAQPVRTYIRAALESLDLQYLYHQKQIPDTTVLREDSLTRENNDADADADEHTDGEATDRESSEHDAPDNWAPDSQA